MNSPLTEQKQKLEIRPASLDDVEGIYALLKFYSDNGVLLPRSKFDILSATRDFYVAEDNGEIVACATLLIYTSELGEIRSLAVSNQYMKRGLGIKLIEKLEEDARKIGLSKLMALTYEVGFFEKHGFQVVEMSELPEKVWGACINCPRFLNCDEIAMLKYL